MPTGKPKVLLDSIEFGLAFESFTKESANPKTSLLETLDRFIAYLTNVSQSHKLYLPTDCGLFTGMMLNLNDDLSQPDNQLQEGASAQAGNAYFVKGDEDEAQGVAYHWGTIIMADGSDTVTIEGAVGLHSDFPKLQNDTTWKFEMYGTDEGQTFKDKNAHYFKAGTMQDTKIYSKKVTQGANIQLVSADTPNAASIRLNGAKEGTDFSQTDSGNAGAIGSRNELPIGLKKGVERISGYSMDDVKVHYNSSKPGLLNAFAFTQGTNIHMAPGQEKYLAHEAWHVIQQKQGRVLPTLRFGGFNINDSGSLEKEADIMGNKVQEIGTCEYAAPLRKSRLTGEMPLQGAFVYSYLRDEIVKDKKPDEYYKDTARFFSVPEDDHLVWADPRNIEYVKFLVTLRTYQREFQDPNPESASLNAKDARGIEKMTGILLSEFPPADYEYVFPGASGDAIAMMMNALGCHIHRIAISNIKKSYSSLADLEKEKLKKYFYAWIGLAITSNKSLLLLDAVSSGVSLVMLEETIQKIRDEDSVNHTQIIKVALNDFGDMLKDSRKEDFARFDTDDPDVAFAQKRIYHQKYKKVLPRLLPKVDVEAILSGETDYGKAFSQIKDEDYAEQQMHASVIFSTNRMLQPFPTVEDTGKTETTFEALTFFAPSSPNSETTDSQCYFEGD